VGLAGVAAAKEQPELAAQLLGAATVGFESDDAQLDRTDRVDYEWVMQATRNALGEKFDPSYEQRRLLPIEEAMALALEK
jgi:hypothetical protein